MQDPFDKQYQTDNTYKISCINSRGDDEIFYVDAEDIEEAERIAIQVSKWKNLELMEIE